MLKCGVISFLYLISSCSHIPFLTDWGEEKKKKSQTRSNLKIGTSIFIPVVRMSSHLEGSSLSLPVLYYDVRRRCRTERTCPPGWGGKFSRWPTIVSVHAVSMAMSLETSECPWDSATLSVMVYQAPHHFCVPSPSLQNPLLCATRTMGNGPTLLGNVKSRSLCVGWTGMLQWALWYIVCSWLSK